MLPRPSGELDRDPVALALAAVASFFAIAYLVLVLTGARPRLRMVALALAAAVLVAVPTLAFIAMGAATGRPYGQDGGVVQLPLAIDRILSLESPYGADYANSMLGRQARVSDFWAEHGGNPILHHHAYLPGTHFLMMPFVPVSRALFGVFDPRVATLLAFVAAGALAYRLGSSPALSLCAVAAVWVSPLVYWQQIFGANDILVAALLLGAVHLARASRAAAAAAVLGLACATKQLAWPFAPFLLAHLSGASTLGALVSGPARGRLLRVVGIAAAVFLVVVVPVAALDFRAFWGDIVRYNAGLPGGDNYPLGGTPGLGLANFIVYFGGVTSLRDYVPLSGLYLLLVPIGVWLLREQLRRGTAVDALVTGSAALLLSLYVSRVMHPNYLILAAVLLPAAAAGGAVLATDALIGGLGLLAVAVEIAEGEVFATTWADAVAARWPGAGGLAALAPRAGPALTRDPLGLAFSAIACGLGIALLVGGALRAGRRTRATLLALALVLLAAVPTWIVTTVGRLSGTPRLQDPWAATVWPETDGARPVLREAWSVSFRKDPPGLASGPVPGAHAFGRVLGALGVRDPRVLALLALALVAVLIARAGPRESALERVAASVTLPAAILGVVFGSGAVVMLALALGAALVVARFARVRLEPAIARAAVGIVAIRAAATLVGGSSAASLDAGLGLSNLRLYAGATPGTPDLVGPLLALALGAAALVAGRRGSSDPAGLLGVAAAFSMTALWLAPSAAPDGVLVPIALLAIAATQDARDSFDTPEAAL